MKKNICYIPKENKYFDPLKENNFFKENFNNNSFFWLNRKKLFLELEKKEISKNVKYSIYKNLQTNQIIYSYFFTSYYQKTILDTQYNEEIKEKIFKEIFDYQYYSDFIELTVYLFKNNIHPFQINKNLYFSYNLTNNYIFQPYEQLLIEYKNILNNNNENKYFSNYNLIYHDLKYKNNLYSIIVRKKEKFDLIIPSNKVYFKNNIKPLIKENKIILCKNNILKNNFLFNFINNYFQSLYSNSYYSSPSNISEIKKYILINPFEFLNLLSNFYYEEK